MHCISSLKLVGSMAVGLGLSGVRLVDKSVEINLGEFIYVQNVFLKVGDLVWPVNVHCCKNLLHLHYIITCTPRYHYIPMHMQIYKSHVSRQGTGGYKPHCTP